MDFVFWGGLHGIFLVTHRAWQRIGEKRGWKKSVETWHGQFLGRSITFLAVLVAWVFFRSANFATAARLLRSMAGLNGFDMTLSFPIGATLGSLAGLWFVVWYLPNTQDLLRRFEPALDYRPIDELESIPSLRRFQWKPNVIWAVVVSIVAIFTLTQMSRVSEFIYWQF